MTRHVTTKKQKSTTLGVREIGTGFQPLIYLLNTPLDNTYFIYTYRYTLDDADTGKRVSGRQPWRKRERSGPVSAAYLLLSTLSNTYCVSHTWREIQIYARRCRLRKRVSVRQALAWMANESKQFCHGEWNPREGNKRKKIVSVGEKKGSRDASNKKKKTDHTS